jgi:hypothetical protein
MSSGRSQRVNFRWVLVAGGLVLVLSSAYVFLSTGGSCPIAPTTRNCDATLKTMVTIFTIAGRDQSLGASPSRSFNATWQKNLEPRIGLREGSSRTKLLITKAAEF